MSLVKIIRDDLFVDSLILAEGTNNEHESVRALIRKYENQFRELGTLAISNRESTGGRPEQVVLLNEPQASFLMTLLRNSDVVVAFKLRLVKEFYKMRSVLWERQTSDWLQTRKNGKLVRRGETDSLAMLIPYAEEQGSRNMGKQVYNIYTKLVNSLVGVEAGQRDIVPFKTLSTMMFLEDMILHTVADSMERGIYYKEIYRICKANGEQIMRFAYLPRLSA